MKFFILAAGHGKRAHPLSSIIPKPLFPLNGTPLINRMLDQLARHTLTEGFINLHAMPEKIKTGISAHGSVKFFLEKALSGSRILKRSLSFISDFLLIINGDIYLEIPYQFLLERLLSSQADGILLIRPNDSLSYPSLLVEDDQFMGIAPSPLPGNPMYTGVAIFNKQVISSINSVRFFDTLKKNFNIKVYPYHGIWLDFGTPESYFHSNFKFKEHFKDSDPNAVSQKVSISDNSCIHHSIIWRNTFIKNQANIQDCIITGNITISGGDYQGKIISRQGIFDLKV